MSAADFPECRGRPGQCFLASAGWRIGLLCLLGALWFSWLEPGTEAGEGWWEPERPEQLLEAARGEGRLVWLVTFSEHCGCCDLFKRDLMADPIMEALTAAYAIRAQAQVSTARGKAVAGLVPWRGTPDSFLLDSGGRQLARQDGTFYFAYAWIFWLRRHGAELTPGAESPLHARLQELAGKARELTPSARAALAWSCLRTGRADQARNYFGVPYLPLLPDKHAMLGMSEFWSDPGLAADAQGRALAVETARALVRQYPQDEEIKRVYAGALAAVGKTAAACRVFSQSLPPRQRGFYRMILVRPGGALHPAAPGRKT